MAKERFNNSFKILEFIRICLENNASVTGWQNCFSHTNAFTFWWLLQQLRLRYMAENSQAT